MEYRGPTSRHGTRKATASVAELWARCSTTTKLW